MSLVVTKDERDNKTDGARALRRELASKGAVEEMQYRELEISRTAISNPDPARAYRLVNRENKGRAGVLKGYGYRTEKEDSEAQLVHGEHFEGGQIHGDLVLMSTTIENYERRKALKRARHEAQTGAAMAASKERVNKIARDGKAVKAHEDAVYDESGNT